MNIVYAMTRKVYEWILPSLRSLKETNPKAKVFILCEDDHIDGLPVDCEFINVSGQQWFPEWGVNYHNNFSYINLLKGRPLSDETARDYISTIERQSVRLKKLMEDLIDMSKANTGNMQVEITTVDAVEAVNQALGEFSDKLERARLYPVFRHSESSVPIMADGKLVWRVLSNLLSNAVKYAMPGTRVYVEVLPRGQKVEISIKNISAQMLNISSASPVRSFQFFRRIEYIPLLEPEPPRRL